MFPKFTNLIYSDQTLFTDIFEHTKSFINLNTTDKNYPIILDKENHYKVCQTMNDCFSCNYQFSSIVCLKARINAEAARTQCQVADREVKSTASACNLDSYMISTLRCHYCDVVIFVVQIF